MQHIIHWYMYVHVYGSETRCTFVFLMITTVVDVPCSSLLLTMVAPHFDCNWASLTLGAHAQRGLQYLVCVSVCVSVCYHVFCHRAQQCVQQDIPAASAGHEQSFKNGVFFKNAWFRSYGVICLPRQRPALLQRPLASFSDDRGF